MQKYLDYSHVSKNILRQIMKACHHKGIVTTEGCMSLLMRLVILDPSKEFLTMDDEQCENAVDELAELVIKKLSRELSPSLLTIKMQAYFYPKFSARENVVREHRHAITKLTEPLMRELMEKDLKEKDFLDALYHKLVVAITLLSGLGNPTNRAVLCTASAALSSIFPVNELPRFLALGRLDKERQIEELTQVVAGIRIFNYDTHKHVEGIDDLPNILKEACIALRESLENERTSVRNFIQLLCQFLEASYVERPNEEDPDTVNIVLMTHLRISDNDVEFFRDLLNAKRQMDACIGCLVDQVEKSAVEVDSSYEVLRSHLTDLQESVRYRTAIPTAYIYPKFMQISYIWSTLQDQMVLLSSYNDILQKLKSFFNEFDQKTNLLETAVESIRAQKQRNQSAGHEHTNEGVEKNYDIRIDQLKIHNCHVVYTDEDNEQLQGEPEFLGCCALRLAEGNGALLPGNPKIGMLNFGMLNYCFATCASAYTFDKNPEAYVKKIFTLVRRMPELISLLNMNEDVDRYVRMKELKTQIDEEFFKADSGTQTELHPVESYIDPEYSWDLWELKRRAVQLANICKMKTHSTQTFKSNMRMSVGTQTYPLKEISTQTKRDNKANMPKLSTFIFGLRGRNDNLAHTAILTRPNDEWLHEPGAKILTKSTSK